MRYLVLSSHDERYDFNFEFRVVDSIDEYFNDNVSKYKRECLYGGIIKFERVEREALGEEFEAKLREKIEKISFSILYFIPENFLKDKKNYTYDPFINKVLKYGILDLKDLSSNKFHIGCDSKGARICEGDKCSFTSKGENFTGIAMYDKNKFMCVFYTEREFIHIIPISEIDKFTLLKINS